MVMSLSPVDDTINSVSNLVNNNINDNLRVNTSNTDRSPNNNNFEEGNTTNERAIALIQSSQVNGFKRKSSRRANTAERRATHNAVERHRRETLNGRFLVCPLSLHPSTLLLSFLIGPSRSPPKSLPDPQTFQVFHC